MGCLDDNTAVEFAGGNLPRGVEARVEAHLATCRECRTLVAALAPSAHDADDSDIVTAPRQVARGKRGHGIGLGTAPAGPSALAAALRPTDPKGSEPGRPLEPVVAVGDTISRYVVLRRVGAGGMGVVYAAYDPQLDRKVALKLLRTGIGLGEGEARARLVREAQAIAQLSHPNVVAVYDVGTTADGEVYVAMEFVEGDTLTQWMHRWDRSWRDTLEVFRDAGRGLAAAHAVGLLHRDFKPDNVLVGADGRVRVTDFGLARSLVTGHADEKAATPSASPVGPLRVTLTATGAVMGTPRYMAPEQLRGQDVSAAADQFSFCVALYEALYGHHPIAGDTAVKIVEEGARAQAPTAPERAPSWIWPVLARGLDPQPARRYPSMSALLVELTPPAPSPRRRTYVVTAAAAALVLGGAAAATVLTPKPVVPPQIDPEVIVMMNNQIVQLRKERDELGERIAAMVAEDAKNDAKLAELARELVSKQERINALQGELDKIAKVVKPPPARPKPPIDTGGVSQLQLKQGAEAQLERFAGCMREWAERSMGTATTVTIGFQIDPSGRVRDPSSAGIDDRIVPQCLATALAAQTFPAAPRVTKAQIEVKYYEGQTRVETRHLGTEEAPPRIDE